MTQPKQTQPSNSSWRPEIRPISTRLPWNHTWSNLFRESWSIRCCSESSCPWQMQRALSTHTWQVTQTYTWQVTHTHTWEVTDLTVLYLNMFCDQLHFHCHPLRGAASNGKGGESHQRDAEDLWGLRLRVWPAGSRAEWSRQTGKHNDTHTHTHLSVTCVHHVPWRVFFSSTLRWRRSRWGSFWSTRRWSGWTHCPLWVAWGRNQSWRCLVGEVSSSHFFTCTGNNWWRITQVCLCPQCSNEPSSWFTVRTANWRRRWWVHVYSSSPNLYNWTDLYVYLCQCKQKNTVTKKLTKC